jgi:fructokinase
MTIVSIGEILWDVFPSTEHLGGASFNFAAHARRLDHEVVFISAVGADERGSRALERMRELDLSARFVRSVPGAATGTVTVELDAVGQPRFTLHRPAAYDLVELSDSDLEQLAALKPDWIYFGTLHQMDVRAREVTRRLVDAIPAARCFYDINLRVDSYERFLVRRLMTRADVVKLNDTEVAAVETMFGSSSESLERFCGEYAREFGWESVCVTRGARGCALLAAGEYVEAEGYPVQVADTVGAGDAFAAAFLHGLNCRWPAARIADFANRVGAVIASKPGGTPLWTPAECEALKRG